VNLCENGLCDLCGKESSSIKKQNLMIKIDKIITLLNEKASSGSFENTQLTEFEITFLAAHRPENKLIIYGSLAPNAPNHHIVAHIKGTWHQGIVRGKLMQYGWGADLGYYAFMPVSEAEQAEIKAFVLISEELTANWAYLDDFEGEGYKRILAKYTLDNGQIGVGYIYAMNDF
jgi:gamma-glutamylcyclotransferase (GGCT)/AIG2-like uncharacterized protein YtfP